MRGATPSRILEQLKLAIEGSYRASGNKDTELDKALLVTAIASRLLPMLNQENGFGTEDSIKKDHRDEVPRFVAFVCHIELGVLLHNFEKTDLFFADCGGDVPLVLGDRRCRLR